MLFSIIQIIWKWNNGQAKAHFWILSLVKNKAAAEWSNAYETVADLTDFNNVVSYLTQKKVQVSIPKYCIPIHFILPAEFFLSSNFTAF